MCTSILVGINLDTSLMYLGPKGLLFINHVNNNLIISNHVNFNLIISNHDLIIMY